jgi:hypothetical protein
VHDRALLIGLLVVPVGLLTLGLTTLGEESFTIVVVLEEEQEEDLGEEGPSVGDLYAFSGPLFDESEDTELGRFDGVCTTTSSPDLTPRLGGCATLRPRSSRSEKVPRSMHRASVVSKPRTWCSR